MESNLQPNEQPTSPPDFDAKQPQSLPASPKRKSPLVKWLLWLVAGVLGVIIVLLAVLPTIARVILRHELQSAIAGNLNANLEIDDLSWRPLLGVSIGHARLVGVAPDGSPLPLLQLGGLEVNLAKIPFGGPIIVDRCIINDPVVNLVRLPSGQFQVQQGLLRKTSPKPAAAAPAGPWKPSAIVEVKRFELNNLIIQESQWKSTDAPQVLAVLNVTADLTTAPGGYDFHVSIANKPLADMTLDGSVNIDETALTFNDFSLNAQLPGDDAAAQIPAEFRPYLNQYGVAGLGAKLAVTNNAAIAFDLEKGRWSIHGLDGTLELSTLAPAKLATGRVLFSINAGGPLPGGQNPVDASYLAALDPDTKISIKTDSAQQLSLVSPLLPQAITRAGGDLEFTGGVLHANGLTANYGEHVVSLDTAASLAENHLKLQGTKIQIAGGALLVDTADFELPSPHAYSATVSYTSINLSEVRDMAQLAALGNHLSGTAAGNIKVTGTLQPNISPLQSLQGNGNLHVENGDFYDIPVLAQVAGKVNANIGDTLGSSTRVGEAAAVYDLEGGELHLSKLAISSPILGIQGTGKVGLLDTNPLDMNLVIAPLGDWKKQIDKTGIPFLGQVLGGVQKALNKTTEKVLYSFHVTGPAAKPHIEAVPAPALTAGADDIFSQMIKGGGNLLDAVKPKN